MRKSKLIEKLSEFPKNSTVKIWNGYVSVIVNVGDIIVTKEKRLKKEWHVRFIAQQECDDKVRKLIRDGEVVTEEMYKQILQDSQLTKEQIDKLEPLPFEYYTLDDERNRDLYEYRDVIVISPKNEGKTTWDRLGSISY